MNLQEQVRIRDKIFRLEQAVSAIIAELEKLRQEIEKLKEKRPVGRPRNV